MEPRLRVQKGWMFGSAVVSPGQRTIPGRTRIPIHIYYISDLLESGLVEQSQIPTWEPCANSKAEEVAGLTITSF